MRGWISVEEKLPEVFKDVLVVTSDGYVSTTCRYDPSQGRDENEWALAHRKIMYWMNIPKIDKLVGVEKDGWIKGAAS